MNIQIVNLPYLENVPESEFILGGAGVTVTSDTTTSSDTIYTFTVATTNVKTLPSGVSIAKGKGLAVAVGDGSTANVTIAGDGDIVAGKTQSQYLPGQDTAIARGVVIAIDLPSKSN